MLGITWQERKKEWRALLDFCYENREELEKAGRMRALTVCLKRHWKDMLKLKRKTVL